jgi:trehalose 6-phosphate phosphatase
MTSIQRQITARKRIFLFLDYDGTLVPIKKEPGLAVLTASKRRLLERLSRTLFIGIVSGRSLADIQRTVSIEDIAYVGNHGLEISCRNRGWVHPGAKRIKPVLRTVLRRIRRKTQDRPGLLVEDKGLTGSIHYRRLTTPLPKELRDLVEREVRLRHGELLLTEGKKVLEIRPRIDWDKGAGVLKLSRWLGINRSDLRIYAGDDRTDEDAFRALGGNAITIRVGKPKDSSARFHLPDVAAVWEFLSALLSLAPPPSKGHVDRSCRSTIFRSMS